MDVTYKVSAREQIRGNTFLQKNDKTAITKIIDIMTEAQIKRIAWSDNQRGRFFYNINTPEEMEECYAVMIHEMGYTSQRNILQGWVNSEAREGRFYKTLREFGFVPTYTKSGHKYVDGKRIY